MQLTRSQELSIQRIRMSNNGSISASQKSILCKSKEGITSLKCDQTYKKFCIQFKSLDESDQNLQKLIKKYAKRTNDKTCCQITQLNSHEEKIKKYQNNISSELINHDEQKDIIQNSNMLEEYKKEEKKEQKAEKAEKAEKANENGKVKDQEKNSNSKENESKNERKNEYESKNESNNVLNSLQQENVPSGLNIVNSNLNSNYDLNLNLDLVLNQPIAIIKIKNLEGTTTIPVNRNAKFSEIASKIANENS